MTCTKGSVGRRASFKHLQAMHHAQVSWQCLTRRPPAARAPAPLCGTSRLHLQAGHATRHARLPCKAAACHARTGTVAAPQPQRGLIHHSDVLARAIHRWKSLSCGEKAH